MRDLFEIGHETLQVTDLHTFFGGDAGTMSRFQALLNSFPGLDLQPRLAFFLGSVGIS